MIRRKAEPHHKMLKQGLWHIIRIPQVLREWTRKNHPLTAHSTAARLSTNHESGEGHQPLG